MNDSTYELNNIFQDNLPRIYGNIPKLIGNYEMIAPSQRYNQLLYMKNCFKGLKKSYVKSKII